MKIYLASLIIFLIVTNNLKSQTNNDILNLLIQRKLITAEDADSLRSDDAMKQQETQAKRKSFNLTASRVFQLSGYMQARYQIDDQPGKIDGFDIRRAYLDLKGSLSPYWNYRIQTDFSNTPKIIDAYVELKLNDYFNFTLGQFILPFSLENNTSNLKLDFIDRSQVVEGLVARGKDTVGYNYSTSKYDNFSGHDIGVQVGGSLFKIDDKSLIEYKLGIINGSGINQTDKNESKDVVARILVNPFTGLSLGASYYNGLANIGKPALNRKRERYGIEAGYDYLNFSVRGEYIQGTDNKVKREGYYVQAGYYVLPQILQLVAKLDAYDPNTGIKNNASKWYIGGINYTFSPGFKLLANYTFKEEQSNNIVNNLFSLQLQMFF